MAREATPRPTLLCVALLAIVAVGAQRVEPAVASLSDPFVQSVAAATSGGTSQGDTLAIDVPAGMTIPPGDTIVAAALGGRQNAPSSVADDFGNTYTLDARRIHSEAAGVSVAVFSARLTTAVVGSGDTSEITVTYPAAIWHRAATAEHYDALIVPVSLASYPHRHREWHALGEVAQPVNDNGAVPGMSVTSTPKINAGRGDVLVFGAIASRLSYVVGDPLQSFAPSDAGYRPRQTARTDNPSSLTRMDVFGLDRFVTAVAAQEIVGTLHRSGHWAALMVGYRAESPAFEVAAVGDIACDPDDPRFNSGEGSSGGCRHEHVSDDIAAGTYEHVLALGDIQYQDSCREEYELSIFRTAAGEHRSWGRFKDKIRPVPGNHEYHPLDEARECLASFNPFLGDDSVPPGCRRNASSGYGYFKSFSNQAADLSSKDFSGPHNPDGQCKGWYAWTHGDWYFIALNSEIVTTEQVDWLNARLDDADRYGYSCVAAYGHKSRWAGGNHGNHDGGGDAADWHHRKPSQIPLWDSMVRGGVDVYLAGHDHAYERYPAMGVAPAGSDGSGRRDGTGPTVLIVGTGGNSSSAIPSYGSAEDGFSNGAAFQADRESGYQEIFGHVRLAMDADGYTTEFVDENPATSPLLDTSVDDCAG